MEQISPQLYCPYCTHPLSDPAGTLDRTDSLGMIACHCQSYPVVDGIPIIRAGTAACFEHHIPNIAEHVRAGRREQAMVEAVRLTGVSLMPHGPIEQTLGGIERLFGTAKGRMAGRRLRRYAQKGRHSDLRGAVRFLRPPRYAEYLYYRQANPSYFSMVAGALLLASAAAGRASEGRPFRILDLACGAGHSTFLLGQFIPSAHMVAMDNDFTNLHLGRRIMPQNSTVICADAESPLPFGDSQFDAVFCADALHYIRSKAALVREVTRTLKPDGLVVVPHLHNAMASNPSAGLPMAPRDYTRLFKPLSVRVCAESAIVESLANHNILDLREQPDYDALNSAVALFLAASPKDRWATTWNADGRAPIASLRVNPAYKVDRYGPKVSLTLRQPSGRLAEESAQAHRRLPGKLELDLALYHRIQRGLTTDEDIPFARELARRFVLIHLPEAYRVPVTSSAEGARFLRWRACTSRFTLAAHAFVTDTAPDLLESAKLALATVA